MSAFAGFRPNRGDDSEEVSRSMSIYFHSSYQGSIRAAGHRVGRAGHRRRRGGLVVEPRRDPGANGRRSPAAAAGPAVTSYADAVARVAPAVVTVRVEKKASFEPTSGIPDDPFFRRFFGDRLPSPERQPRQRGLGSGVIIQGDGRIVTNAHVVDGADRVRVMLTDGREFDAKVVGIDKPTDLAVLDVEATGLPTLPFGDSDKPRVGDVVLAVGNPLGVGQTVTMGILSAKGRATGTGDGSYEDFLQTDAPINQGNSGGALVTAQGELIGINSQILSPSGGNIGIGFAIPASMARHVVGEIVDHGEVRRSRMGVTIQPVTADIARSLNLPSVKGALVNGVEPGSPAAHAGLEDRRRHHEVQRQAARQRQRPAQPGGVDGSGIEGDGHDRAARAHPGRRRAVGQCQAGRLPVHVRVRASRIPMTTWALRSSR